MRGDCLVWSYSNSAQLPQIKHGGTKWGWNTIQLYPKLKINLTKLKDLVTKFDNATYIFQGKEAIWGVSGGEAPCLLVFGLMVRGDPGWPSPEGWMTLKDKNWYLFLHFGIFILSFVCRYLVWSGGSPGWLTPIYKTNLTPSNCQSVLSVLY